MITNKHNIVSTYKGNLSSPIVFICEHASNHIPAKFHNLGLSDDFLKTHVAWDIGACQLSQVLAKAFDAPLVMSNISRLVYDCNRSSSMQDAIPTDTEQGPIPGNQNLSENEITQRIETYYHPFEKALAKVIKTHLSTPVIINVHSFTTYYYGKKREVDIGILHDSDSRMADAILQVAKQYPSINIQRNNPYGPEDGVMHTLQRHAIANQLHNFMLEVRNDLLLKKDDIKKVSQTLIKMIEEALSICGVHTAKFDHTRS